MKMIGHTLRGQVLMETVAVAPPAPRVGQARL